MPKTEPPTHTIAAVGADLEKDQCTLINNVKLQPFAHPFEISKRKKR